MNFRYRTNICLLSALLAFLAAAPAWAQGPKPKPPAQKTDLEDSAVAAILEIKPNTPAECIRAAKILADLGRPDLAKSFLKKAIDAKLGQRQLADLGEQLGSPIFIDLAGRAALRPEARQLADAVAAALSARLQNAKRIARLIRQLQNPSPEKRWQAVIGLQEARGAAICPLLAVLADPDRTTEWANVRAALAEMGPPARGPLVAVVERADPKLMVQAIQVLGAMKDPKVALCLLRPCLSENSDAEVRAAAATALKRLTGRVLTRAEAAGMLTDAAKVYFNRKQPVDGVADGVVDGRVEVWRWDEDKRHCVARSVTPESAARTMAVRWARDAYFLTPDDREVRLLHLVTMLEAAAYAGGLDRPLNEKNPAVAEAKPFGVKTLGEVLEYAMAHGHPAAAAAVARLLGQIGTADELLYQGAEPAPLVRAVRSPDRRLRMAASEAIVRLRPRRPFAGSSYVPQALGFLAASGGVRRALVACPNLAEARDLAGRLAAAGFQVDTATSGKELLLLAARSPDYELALIDVTIDRPVIGILLQQLRHDERTASLRVGLIARSGYFDQAERLARRDSLAKAFSRPRDERAFRWQLVQLDALAPEEFVDFEARQRQAARALDLLAELSRSSSKLYDPCHVQDCAIAALSNPKLAARAVAVLANFNSAEGQRALVDLASRFTQPLELRQAAAKAFRQNIEKHGILLTTEEIRRQYRHYNESEKQDVATQRVLGSILDCLEVSAAAKK